MARYSDLEHPHVAVVAFRGLPGNYVIYFADGSAYPGRQSSGGNRIRAALDKWAGDVAAVRFMIDHRDDPCVRARREESAVAVLLNAGIALRNQRWPGIPRACYPRYWSRL